MPQRKPWYRHSATLVAAIAAVISLGSAGVSFYFSNQANQIAKQQEIAAEQQELLALVTDIAQEPVTIAQESAGLQGNSTAQHSAEAGTQLTELADAEEANSILGFLPLSDETAEEYYYAAVGLLAGGSDKAALGLLRTAATLRPDPRTSADIFRTDAEIYYQDNNKKKAENDINLAEKAFQGQSMIEQQYNLAYTDFFDAQYQATIDCPEAQQEFITAEGLLNTVRQNPGAAIAVLMNELTTDEAIPNINKPIPPFTGGIASKKVSCKNI